MARGSRWRQGHTQRLPQTGTWDASLLGTSDGSAVELVVVGNRSGGSPTKRRTVEVGAVEWKVHYMAPSLYGFHYLRARYYDPASGADAPASGGKE